jgi:hypothetical protein
MAEGVRVYTSIAPKHELGDEQLRCARSWMDAGIPYTTVNGHGDKIEAPEGADVVRVKPSQGYRRPYVYLDSIIEQAISDDVDVAIITNSDIELVGDIRTQVHQANYGMVIARRINHQGEVSKGKEEQWGIDVFMLSRDTLRKVPRNCFVLGQTWWDYWLPYWAIKEGRSVYLARPGNYGHRSHNIQHSPEEWARMTVLFQGMTGHMVGKAPHDTGMNVWRTIGVHSKPF